MRKRIGQDRGMTLIELLIALIISSLLVVLVGRVMSDASSGLERATADSIAAQQTMNFARQIKYDIAGATDVFIFGTTLQGTIGDASYSLCSTTRKNDSVQDWAWPSGNQTKSFARGLLTLKVAAVDEAEYRQLVQSNGPDDFLRPAAVPGEWPQTQWIGYEIRRTVTASKIGNFELWRVTCTKSATNGSPEQAAVGSGQKVLDLGATLPNEVSGASQVLCCRIATGGNQPDCGESDVLRFTLERSTAKICPSYSFTVPYGGDRRLINALGNNGLGDVKRLLQRLTRKVDANALS